MRKCKTDFSSIKDYILFFFSYADVSKIWHIFSCPIDKCNTANVCPLAIASLYWKYAYLIFATFENCKNSPQRHISSLPQSRVKTPMLVITFGRHTLILKLL